jgi:hypothetical protein
MGRLEDWQERTDEWAERIDELLRRERRPGEQPPKVLYFTAILTVFVIFILVVYIAFFQGDEGQKTVLDDAPAAPVIPAGSEDCSARDFPGIELTDQDDLPTEVAETRLKVGQLAAECDLDALVALMPDDFRWALDQTGPDGARADWEAKEAAAQPLMLRLAQVSTLDHDVADDGTYVFPAASQWGAPQWASPRPADEAALVNIYGQEAVSRWKASGTFDGYRISIRPDGTWVVFAGGSL